jgi:hypothetical protein
MKIILINYKISNNFVYAGAIFIFQYHQGLIFLKNWQFIINKYL